jgi:hypothetical protein
MPLPERRVRASFGLMAFSIVFAGFQILPASVTRLSQGRDWIKAMRAARRGATLVPGHGTVLQSHGNDCAAACLKMVLAAHGMECSLEDLNSRLGATPRGVSMLNLRLVAANLGLPARSWVLGRSDLARVPVPAIAFISGDHFVVFRRLVAPDVLEVDDPALGRLRWPVQSFRKVWKGETLVFNPGWVPR